MGFYKITGIFFISFIVWGCKQEISIKKGKFTAINPVSYTDVLYKTNRDTVFVSTFDGKIYEVISGNAVKQEVAAIDDEIYAMAYNADKKHLYAATLRSGIVIINTLDGNIVRQLPLKATWAKELIYNAQNGILATYDLKGHHYLWNTHDDFKQIETPEALKQLRPKYILDNGDVCFEGNGTIMVWNCKANIIVGKHKAGGQLTDVDTKQNYLLLRGKEFSFFDTKADSLRYMQQHPDWPVYVADKDTVINVPLSLEITSGIMTANAIYTCGLDKSLRRWDKQSGDLLTTYPPCENTPSAMDISQDHEQLVIVDLGGGITFQEL